MIFDTHIHTDLSSCSTLDVHDMVRAASDVGLDGICITDHQTMDVRYQIPEGLHPSGIIVIIGMEYETPDGDFLIFGPYENLATGMDAPKLLAHVKKTGGAAIAAHPFRADRGVSEYIIHDGLCRIVEAINGRNSEIENLKVRKWQDSYPITATGGSDAHTDFEIGKNVTRFFHPIHTRKDFIQAINTGKCQPEYLSSPISIGAFGIHTIAT